MRACIEEEVPVVSTSASNQKKHTIRKALSFSKQPAKVDLIENATQLDPKGSETAAKATPALNTGNCEVLGSS